MRDHVLQHEALAAILDQGATFHPASLDLRQEEREGKGVFLSKRKCFCEAFFKKKSKKTNGGGGYSIDPHLFNADPDPDLA